MNILWTSRSKNSKTGNIPTAWVGKSKEEAKSSCNGCSLLDNGCYAWSGSVRMGHSNLLKKAANGADRSLDAALQNRHRKATSVRLTGIGDIGRCGKSTADQIVERIKNEGLSIIGYTHHWRENSVADAWKGRLMASCETEADADKAVSKGWRATMIVGEDSPRSFKTASGNTVSVCPAQIREGSIDCNTCRLCDASRNIVPIIAFVVHGKKKKTILNEGHLSQNYNDGLILQESLDINESPSSLSIDKINFSLGENEITNEEVNLVDILKNYAADKFSSLLSRII